MSDKNKAAVALGALGGKARARNLSKEERSKIARLGGKARAAKSVRERTDKQSASLRSPKSKKKKGK